MHDTDGGGIDGDGAWQRSKLVAWTLVAALASAVAIASALSAAENLGHRLGGDVFEPENTLVSYRQALAELQDRHEFRYSEFDVQESADGALVVFHDTDSIQRLVPRSPHNLAVLQRVLKHTAFADVRIDQLSAEEITSLELAEDARIPLLEEVLLASVRWNLRKPMLVEVKSLRTDLAREALIALVAEYRTQLDVNFLAFPANYGRSFPDVLRWSARFKQHGLRVYTARRPKIAAFDLAKDAPPSIKSKQEHREVCSCGMVPGTFTWSHLHLARPPDPESAESDRNASGAPPRSGVGPGSR